MALPVPSINTKSISNGSITSQSISSGYTPNSYTWTEPDEVEETVTTEEWEEERNGAMVKIRKTVTKRTTKKARNNSVSPYWQYYTQPATTKPQFNYDVKTTQDYTSWQRQFEDMISASNSTTTDE